MSTWRVLAVPAIPGVSTVIGTVGSVADTLAGLMGTLADAIDALAAVVSLFVDPLQAIIAGLISALQDLVDWLRALLAGGVFFYLDKGPYFSGGKPDGLTGFLDRWAASFDDLGDLARPVFSEATPVSAMIILTGAQSLPDFSALLRPLALLFGIPSLQWPEDEEPPENLPAAVEAKLSTPPDWASKTLGEILPPMETLVQALEEAIGAFQIPETYANMLSQLAAIIRSKAIALSALATMLQDAADAIIAISESTGMYALTVSANGIQQLKDAVTLATGQPEWVIETWVAGVCLLGATADFGPVVELLGG